MTTKKSKKEESSSESSEESSSEDSSSEESGSEDSESGSEDSESEAESSEESASEEEEEVKKPAPKRKAEESFQSEDKKARSGTPMQNEGNVTRVLFVGGLSYNVDRDWLREECQECENITSCRIATDRETGKSRGFGYIEFADAESAQAAMEALNGKVIDGRPIRLDFAAERPPSPEGGNRGGFGGSRGGRGDFGGRGGSRGGFGGRGGRGDFGGRGGSRGGRGSFGGNRGRGGFQGTRTTFD